MMDARLGSYAMDVDERILLATSQARGKTPLTDLVLSLVRDGVFGHLESVAKFP